MNQRAFRLAAASIIAAAGFYLLITLLNSIRLVIPNEVFILPGQFLYLCFRAAAYYLPLYFLISAFLLFADYYNGRIFTAQLLSLVPFFTFSILLRILDYYPGSPAADYLIETLGIRNSSMVVGLFLIIEILLIYRLATIRKKPRAEIAERNKIPEEPEYKFEPLPLAISEETISAVDETGEEADETVELFSEAEPDAEADDEEELDMPEDLEEAEESEEVEASEDEVVFEDVFEEQTVEPLDLDPEAGNIDENYDEPLEIEAVEPEDEKDDAEVKRTPVPNGEESLNDAPVRGDESETEEAAKAVWAEAEQLGFEEFKPEERQLPVPAIESVDEPENEEIDEDLSIEIPAGVDTLEIPVVFEAAQDVDELEELEEIEEIGKDEEPAVEPILFEEAGPEEEVNQIPSVPPAPQKKKKPGKYSVPVKDILDTYDDSDYWVVDDETRAAAEVLRETLQEFRIAAEVTGISRGPVITMFEILPAPGVKLSKIVNLADNIALRLAASRVRIVAPIPGKHAVGIEVPNKNRAIVSFKEILEADDLKKTRMTIPVVLGKDITGGARVIDLVQTPHLLIAGATGSGKSVCVNSLICSILYSRKPEEVKLILIDPKIVELKMYNDIPHLLTPVITEPKKAFQALQYCMCEMERRYSLLNSLGVRDIKSYNRKIKESRMTTEPIPYIVIIVDEFADLMATTGKELESVISRLAAMSRAIGIHLVLATQRPSVDVITGLIKANIPSRIAFMVASKMDSRIILDNIGADKLLGKGDMLFTSAWDPNPVRIQGAFLSDDEVERITDHVKTLGEPDYIDDEIFVSDEDGSAFELENPGAGDPLMDSAVSIVVDAGKASASYLQRRLKIGYNRAARLVEEMEDRGIVGPANGSKPREIIHIPDRV